MGLLFITPQPFGIDAVLPIRMRVGLGWPKLVRGQGGDASWQFVKTAAVCGSHAGVIENRAIAPEVWVLLASLCFRRHQKIGDHQCACRAGRVERDRHKVRVADGAYLEDEGAGSFRQ